MSYPEGFIVAWTDGSLGQRLFGMTLHYDLDKANESAERIKRKHLGETYVLCSEHRDAKLPSGSCHYCAMLNPDWQKG